VLPDGQVQGGGPPRLRGLDTPLRPRGAHGLGPRPLFTTRFWRELHARLGTKLQLSTSFHPQTDGRSERTNKTALQVLRGWVDASQSGWRDKLGLTEYAINSAVNETTGTAPFKAVLGFMPRVSPRFPGVEDVLERSAAGRRRTETLARTEGLKGRNRVGYGLFSSVWELESCQELQENNSAYLFSSVCELEENR